MFTLKTATGSTRAYANLADALAYCTLAYDACGFAPVIVDESGAWVEYHFNARNVAVAA